MRVKLLKILSYSFVVSYIVIACNSNTDNKEDQNTENIAEKICVSNVDTVQTNGLIIYYPNYNEIDLAFETMPSPNDRSVLMACEAAFTGELLKEFKHSNIAGNHTCGGVFYKGYKCRANTGCFAFYNDTKTWDFAIGDYNKYIKKASEHDGCGFGQVMLIYNYKRQPKNAQKQTSRNHYRVLAEYNDRLCIIDSRNVMNYNDFVNALLNIKVKHALYLDMGSGWNFSFYRDNQNKIHYIHKKKILYTTNWITFKK